MDLERAHSLAEYFNSSSTRFQARVLNFDSKGWVLLADTHASGERTTNPEAISDPEEYLRRADLGTLKLDDECRRLLREWVSAAPLTPVATG